MKKNEYLHIPSGQISGMQRYLKLANLIRIKYRRRKDSDWTTNKYNITITSMSQLDIIHSYIKSNIKGNMRNSSVMVFNEFREIIINYNKTQPTIDINNIKRG